MTTIQELKDRLKKAFEQIKDYEELENEIKVILTRIKNLEALEKVNKSNKWKPSYNDEYYFISPIGHIQCVKWDDNDVDEKLYSLMNCFPSIEDAEFEIKRLKIISKMQEFAFKPNWNNRNELKYSIYYDHYKNDIFVQISAYNNNGSLIFFESEDKAQECLDVVGEYEIKKYYFKMGEYD